MSLKKNDFIELDITSVSSEGQGIGRTDDNLVVFVPNSAIGDKLKIRVLKVKKNIVYGKIEEILIPSNDRIAPDCEVFFKCGGCTYRHISYESELDIKKQKVIDALTRIGKIDFPAIGDVITTNIRSGYRNKAMIPVAFNNGKIEMGFYSKHSHRINTCLDCRLSPGIFNSITKTVYDFLCEHTELPYDETTGRGFIRHLYLRYAQSTGEVMVCFVVNGDSFSFSDIIIERLIKKYSQIKSVLINVNTEKTNVVLGKRNILLWGKDYIVDKMCGLSFIISPNSFYQVNKIAAELLYEKAKEYASPKKDDVILDLYCGTGTIGLSMAECCKKVIGIEIVEEAVKDAEKNMLINEISNAQFICGDAKSLNESIQADIIIVDPPRKGLDPDLIHKIVKIKSEKIVYISCDPATLARDLSGLCSDCYTVDKISVVDMFPGSFHVETVVLMSRVER